MSAKEEFFIGWQGKSPENIGKFLQRWTVLIILCGVVSAMLLAFFQQTIGRAWFEFGNVRTFEGLLVKSPVPMLLADSPDEQSGESVYLLVSPFKYGFPEETAEKFHLEPVTIRGTLIYNESGGAMIEAVETLSRRGPDDVGVEFNQPGQESRVELTGEIVDSKCWLGVMNPGALKPHRACAINCIRGGIPPVLLVDRRDMFILVGENGEPVNDAVLDHVALPVTIPGTLVDYGAIRVLKADPAKIRPAEIPDPS